jgi:hypothetical protein
MSVLKHDTLVALDHYKILPPPEGSDAFVLILRAGETEFICRAARANLLTLAAAIQKYVVEAQEP